MRQKVGEFFQDVYPPMTVITETRARTDFSAARNYAITLISIHDTSTGGKAGRPRQELEALKRSALILAVTAWESFVEDTVTQQLETRLATATKPSDMHSVFNSVADEWLDPQRSGKRHGPDLAQWVGDGWKSLIRASLADTLDTFHTPNTDNTNKLFKRFLGIAIKDKWSWQGVGAIKAERMLDALIKLRGRAVHRGKTFHPLSTPEPDMQRNTVEKALNLIYNLVDATEHALGISPTP